MKKRISGLLMALVMMLSLMPTTVFASMDTRDIRIGAVYVGDENEGYTAAHMEGLHAAMAKLGIPDDAIVEYTNTPEDETCYYRCIDLAEAAGCNVIFANSYGYQTYCAQAAQEHPDVQIVAMAGDFAAISGLDNFSNASCSTYESRYVSGVVAGMKLKQLLDDGTIIDPYVGYVAAFPYAEVVSGYTAFFLGIKSIVADAHMDVQYTQSWFDLTKEADAANALMARGCVIIGQHSDSTGAPSAVEAALAEGRVAYSVGYNIDMLSVAPNAALTSAQNNWEVYFEYALSQVLAGKKIAADWCKGYAEGAVMISALGESCAPGTAEKVAEVEAAIKNGSLKVFDTANFTVGGAAVTSAPVDLSYGYWGADGFTEIYHADTVDAIVDGAFAESTFRAAPYFDLRIDGITELSDDDYPDTEEFTVMGTVSVGETVVDILDGAVAYYAFTPEEDGMYVFTSIGDDDTWGTLYDANRIWLTDDDDCGSELNFRITWDMNAGEMYYIGVKTYFSSADSITLSVNKHDHVYYDGYCECGAVDPNHEHVAGKMGLEWKWDEEVDDNVCVGHYVMCAICECQMGEVEPHNFQDNYCTACGVVDPNHEHVLGYYEGVWQWDEEKGRDVNAAHVAYCDICGREMSAVEPHTYDGPYCTACGAINPDHEHVAGRYEQVWRWNGETDESEDIGHATSCTICDRRMSDIEPHTYDGPYCTICGALDPNHAHEGGEWCPNEQEDSHYLACRLCGARMSEDEAHSYEHGRCTACGAASADHVHSYKYFDRGTGSHCSVCTICHDVQMEGKHTYDSNGVCTACGYERDFVVPDAISIRNGENKELIITLTYADGTSRDMIVQGVDFYRGGGSPDGWTNGTGCIYTDAGKLGFGYFLEWNKDGRLYAGYGFRGDKNSNTLDDCEWFTVYWAARNENITDYTLNYSDGVWTAVGKAYDGEPVRMTMDGDGNVLSYEVGTPDETGMLGDVNNDKKVNQKDVARLRQYIADSGNYPLDAPQNADVNKDGKINQKDVARLRQYIADSVNYPLG